MKSIGIILSVITLFLSVGCATDTTRVVSGYISVKGSMPYTYIVIEDKVHHKEYKIENAEAFHLESRQREKVTMEVSWVKDAVGPGFPAVIKVVKLY